MISNVATTSRQALARLSQPGKNTQGDDVFEVISKACAAGRKDLSLREIKHLYQDAYSVDIDVSTVSARVNVLVKAKRLVRDPVSRPCTLSGVLIGPVSLVPTQPDLPY